MSMNGSTGRSAINSRSISVIAPNVGQSSTVSLPSISEHWVASTSTREPCVGRWVISNFVVHPLLMNRDGRAAAVARATYDVAGMFNRGAYVDDFTIDPG